MKKMNKNWVLPVWPISSGRSSIIISKIQSIFGMERANNIAPGWSSLALLILISISLNLFCLGVIGEYIGKIYEEVKKRPRVVVRKTDLISGPDPN